MFQFDRQIPSIFVSLYRRGSLDANSVKTVNQSVESLPWNHADPNFVLPGAVESEGHSNKNKGGSFRDAVKLKVKWHKLRILLKAVTSFQGPESSGRFRSMSDPELGNKMREEEIDKVEHNNKCMQITRTNTTWSL